VSLGGFATRNASAVNPLLIGCISGLPRRCILLRLNRKAPQPRLHLRQKFSLPLKTVITGVQVTPASVTSDRAVRNSLFNLGHLAKDSPRLA
jgi:hypothetical protein